MKNTNNITNCINISFLTRIYILLLGSLIPCASVKSQSFVIKAVVIDAENRETLPYTNIILLNQAKGTSADILGNFQLAHFNKYDTLVVSYVGYQTKIICSNDIINDTIKLTPQTTLLKPVIISSGKTNKKGLRNITINSFKKKDCYIPFNNIFENDNLWIPYRPMEPTIEAIYFSPNKYYKNRIKIIAVKMYLKSYKLPSEFRLRILAANSDKTPGADLTNENIIVSVNKENQLITINTDHLNIYFPENGLFIGFELLIIEKNKSTISSPDKSRKFDLYSPYLMYHPTSEVNYEYWVYTKGFWSKFSKDASWSDGKLFNKPAISIVLGN
jgi:hypothetical protein